MEHMFTIKKLELVIIWHFCTPQHYQCLSSSFTHTGKKKSVFNLDFKLKRVGNGGKLVCCSHTALAGS